MIQLCQGSSGAIVKATEFQSRVCDLNLPECQTDGMIPTLNKNGFMTVGLDPISLEFIEFSAKCRSPVLDVGAAYGVASISALERGATVIANDVDEGHLSILRERTQTQYWEHLYLNNARFPDEVDFPEQSLGAVLMRRVSHFLTADEMERALDKIKSWLVPGGRLYIVTMSPFHYNLPGFSLEYERRWEAGDCWPGIIHNMHDYAPHIADYTTNFLHVMDEKVLTKALEKRSLKAIKVVSFDYAAGGVSLNAEGQGYCGAIAEKV
jgi:SAM-dependent methyltransferase